jgi:hypothetical protein
MKTVQLLDERMFTSTKDPARAAEMERALRAVAAPSALGEAKLTSLHCGSTLCKLTLKATQEPILNESITAMSSEVAKTFGASLAIPIATGERAFYVAQSSQDLSVDLAEGSGW